MVKIKLKYLVEDVDRHGNVRCYVRLPGKRKVRIRGLPGSDEFMNAYHAALTGVRYQRKKGKIQDHHRRFFRLGLPSLLCKCDL